MMKSIMLTILISLGIYVCPANAQFLGAPGAMPQMAYGAPGSYAVPGAGVDPGYNNYGAGIYPMAQPCAYGGKVADPIEDDAGVIDAKDAASDLKDKMIDDRKDKLEADKDLRDAKRDFQKDLTSGDPDSLYKTYQACKSVYESSIAKLNSSCVASLSTGVTSLNAETNDDKRKDAWACAIKASTDLSDQASKAQCANAAFGTAAGGSSLDIQHLCVQDNNTFPQFGASGINTKNYSKCRTDLAAFLKAQDKADKAKELADADTGKIKKATKDLTTARKDAQTLIKEEQQLDALTGDATTAGCPTCQAMQRQQLAAQSTGVNKTALITGLAIGGGAFAASSMVNLAMSHQNAQLGYPTGPNPYVSSAGAFGAGYPFIMAGLYGGTYGGTSRGGFGCSPTINSGYMGGGPWAGGMNGGMAYPYGGGMYNPGYGPGWGYAGPWGVSPNGMGGPYGMATMNPYGMGMMNPYGMGGMGIGAGMNPYGMSPYGLGGFAGMNPYGAGISPYGFSPMGAYAGGGLGMGGPYGPFSGPGIGAGFGAGIGMSPYGSAMGSPFAGAGGPFGFGSGGIGGPFGGLGAGGLGGGVYGQQMLQQVQSMMDYQRRLQLYTTTIGQAGQLQSQAASYLGGGLGSSLGGYGGYGGYGGLTPSPYGVGGGLSLGFGASLGGGLGTSGILLPQTTPYLGR